MLKLQESKGGKGRRKERGKGKGKKWPTKNMTDKT